MLHRTDRIAESTRCTAVRSNGRFCDYESLPDAPFPICIKHASQLLRYLKDFMPNALEDRIMIAAQALRDDRERDAPIKERRERESFVYYVRVGAHIKIGYTASLRSRMSAYPPDSVLLGYEPGGEALERQRHREFTNDLRMGREWFHPSPELLAHIERVNVRRSAA